MNVTKDDVFKLNNFDLVRLFAAGQVAVHHAMSHLQVDEGWLADLMKVVPGVPIFFFVSGLLISKSYEANSNLREYSLNRALRIYPALIVCTILSVLSVWWTGYFATQQFSVIHFIGWIVGQMTVFQFYPPPFMRGFGSGVLNGSLWTITVELQFYALTPPLSWALAKMCRTRTRMNAALLLLIAVFLAISVAFHAVDDLHGDRLAVKLVKVSFVPWFYMFLLGVFVQKNFAAVHRVLAGRAVWLAAAYAAATLLALQLPAATGTGDDLVASALSENGSGGAIAVMRFGNQLNPVLFALLAAAVFSCAYSAPRLADSLLSRNDISYGVYIYHMPIVNLMMWHHAAHDVGFVLFALGATLAMAILSWVLIERPAMRLKKHPLFAHGPR